MTKKTGKERTKGRYQQKKDLGLVPHVYDRESKRHMEGAWKNWPHNRDPVTRAISWTVPEHERSVKADIQALTMRPSRFHQFVAAQ